VAVAVINGDRHPLLRQTRRGHLFPLPPPIISAVRRGYLKVVHPPAFCPTFLTAKTDGLDIERIVQDNDSIDTEADDASEARWGGSWH